MGRRSDHTRDQLREMILKSTCQLIEDGGLRGLSIRKIAAEIGYTSGTIYQVFENLDDLIVETHVLTLKDLHAALADVEIGDDPETSLFELAKTCLQFANAHQNRWNAVFFHMLPEQRTLPDHYVEQVTQLLAYGVKAIDPLFSQQGSAEAWLSARVLWSSLYGIVSLETTSKLSREDEADIFIRTLLRNFLAGLKMDLAQRDSAGA